MRTREMLRRGFEPRSVARKATMIGPYTNGAKVGRGAVPIVPPRLELGSLALFRAGMNRTRPKASRIGRTTLRD